jgi:hypothetical protein
MPAFIDEVMLKNLFKKLLTSPPASNQPSDGFFLNVRCSVCGETFKLYVYKSYDLFPTYHPDGAVTYMLKKEIIGAACKNRVTVTMQFDGSRKMLSREIQNGEFLDS